MKLVLIIAIITIFWSKSGFTRETCSRSATVNFQEVLVDSSSTQKGEGLRFYLEKDPIAKSYLDNYQDGTTIKWQNALVGTVGSAFVLGGFLTNNKDRRRSFLITGASLVLINFLMAKTFESSNEENLLKSIDEYNKRNYPKIFFQPLSYSQDFDYELSVAKTWSF